MKNYKCVNKKMWKKSLITETVEVRRCKNEVVVYNTITKKKTITKFINEDSAKKEFNRLTNKNIRR